MFGFVNKMFLLCNQVNISSANITKIRKMKESNRTVVVSAWGLNIQKWYEVERYENLTIDEAAEAVKKATLTTTIQ